MSLIIKNIKDRTINFGTISGRMLSLAPGQTKELDGELKRLFENKIIQYTKDKFITVVKSEPSKEVDYDLNGDGVFDKKDKSLAAKVLRKKTRVSKKTKYVSTDN